MAACKLCCLSFVAEDTYERTLTVDGEETTLIVMDTWENDKQVRVLKLLTAQLNAEWDEYTTSETDEFAD